MIHLSLSLLVLLSPVASAAPLILNAKQIHLGQEGRPEWDWFAGHVPDGRQFEVKFPASSNRSEGTLFIRQADVKQEWLIELNQRRMGRLFLMEADLVYALAIPPGALREGSNTLAILAPKEIDDIVLHDILLDPRPLQEAVGESRLAVEVTEAGTRRALPCRLTVVDPRGVLPPLVATADSPSVAVRPGVVYTGNGRAHLALPAGHYTIFASRGFEWSVATQQVHAAAMSDTRIALQLQREVDTPGLVSCDTHVHTFTHSGHGDATVDERMLTLAGEGIELPIATDHNLQIDYTDAARRMDVAAWFTPVIGNEVTTTTGHFNIFPVDPGVSPPDFRITHWPTLMNALRATPGVRVVILNHPRNIHTGFQPFAATNYNSVTGDDRRGPGFRFDAIELLNSSAQQTDYLLVYRDWFGLLNHGYRITGVGSSDGHDVSRYIIGQGRTYLVCPDQDPARLNVAIACSNLLSGRAHVSLGLLVTMSVEDRFGPGDLAGPLGPEVRVTVRVQAPPWIRATNVALFANGALIREQTIDRIDTEQARQREPLRGTQAKVTWLIPRPAHDVYLVAVATGPGIEAPFWATPRPYQPVSTHWQNRVIGSTNPIWLDADADGVFTAPRGYALKLIEQYGRDPRKLLRPLRGYDEAVSAQAAGLCTAAGADLAALHDTLQSAAPQVRRGFNAFAQTQGK
ncbi:MAG TPA: CehA/McbA family metallohydrolase [Verrucomicrobiae bacterium]|nr:CehA/McbA family metallohydrolase [Verrucomicrobiae bacterium]